jgi:hypothetical protein
MAVTGSPLSSVLLDATAHPSAPSVPRGQRAGARELRRPRPAPAWRVQVEAHEVDRWSIAEQVVKVRAINATQARIEAARQVARAAGMPPWRPLLRRVYVRTRVASEEAA